MGSRIVEHAHTYEISGIYLDRRRCDFVMGHSSRKDVCDIQLLIHGPDCLFQDELGVRIRMGLGNQARDE